MCHCNRLIGVRQKQQYNGPSATNSDSFAGSFVSLFDDYAAKRNRSFVIGCNIRMRHHGKDFRRPVSFSDTRAREIEVHLQLYKEESPLNYIREMDILIQ